LDEWDDGEENAGNDPVRVFVFGWSKDEPEDAAFKQEEGEVFGEWNGLESTRLGGGVGGEEERGKKNDDEGGEDLFPVKVFEKGFEVGLLDKFDEDIGEKSQRGEGGEEEAK